MPDLHNCSVLIVDDTEINIDILFETIGNLYNISTAADGESALEKVTEQAPDLILLDIMMPGIDGYEVCRRLKGDQKTTHIPIIFLTSMTSLLEEEKGLKLGAVDYITKPFTPELVKARVKNQLQLKLYQDKLEELVKQRTVELELTQEITIECMGTLAEYRDSETGGHIQRTKYYVKALAEKLKHHPKFSSFLTEKTIDLLCKSAPLHDVGKIGVPDHILLKPGKLTVDECEEMKRHTIYGRDTIKRAEERLGEKSFLYLAHEMAESHQEKWDGSGYPNGWSGEQIPISGRIMALADVFDAIISKRIYKESIPHSKAVQIIFEGRGRHFDPDIVDAFMELTEEFRSIALKHADYEEERQNLMK